MFSERKRLIYSFIYPTLLVLVLWIVKLFEYVYDTSFANFGIYPQTIKGLAGILFAPFLHGDFDHLLSNSFPLLVLGAALFYFFRQKAFTILAVLWMGTGIWVWISARESYHIGASGIVYGLAGFLVFVGVFTKNRALAALSLVIIFFYGGMIWGIFPTERGISWESHLGGALTGVIYALWYALSEKSEHKIVKNKELWEDEFSTPDISDTNIKEINYEFLENDSESDR